MAQAKSDAQLAEEVDVRSSRVLRWRFVMNLALMLFDALVYFATSMIVLVVSHGTNLVTTRLQLNLPIDPWLYSAACAAIYVYCMHVAGVYHRHVFADGYQLNMLLLKGGFIAWVAICALNFIIQCNIFFYMVCLTSLIVWIAEMIVRFIARVILTRKHRKGEYSYPTVIVGSPRALGRFSSYATSASSSITSPFVCARFGSIVRLDSLRRIRTPNCSARKCMSRGIPRST